MVAVRWLPWLLTSLVTACATPLEDRAEYPASFPQPVRTTSECPAFNGFFRNAGTHISPDGSRSSGVFTKDVLQLGDAFSPDDDIRLSIDSTVTGAFGVPALFGELTEARLRVESKSGHFWEEPKWGTELCTKGALVIPTNQQNSGVGGVPGLVVAGGEGAHLFVGQDGSLIAIRQKVNAGILVIVPFYSRDLGYFQFPKADYEAN